MIERDGETISTPLDKRGAGRGSPLLSIERVWGVTQGCGYRIRAFTVLQRRHPDLFGEV